MTVSNTVASVTYTGDGSTTAFPTTFVFSTSADIEVIERVIATGAETTKTLTTDYTVAGGGGAGNDAATGTVNAVTAPASTVKWTIRRVVAETQGTALPAAGSLPSKPLELMVDRTVMMIQQHSEEIGRSLLAPKTSGLSGLTIPDPTANNLLGWNAGATNLENKVITDASTTVITTFAASLLDDANAAAAQATLGLVIGTDVQAELAVPSQAEAEAGTATDERVWTAQRVGQAIAALSGLPRSYLAGLGLSNAADADHDITFAVGEARNSTDTTDMSLSSAQTKRIDATWATGDAAGGLASGATLSADTWYHCFVGLVGSTVECGFDSSVSAANLVANNSWTVFRRVGAVLTDSSSNILAFDQQGDRFDWVTPPLDVNDSALGTTSKDYTISAPPDTVAIIHPRLMTTAAEVYVRPKLATDEAPIGDTGTAGQRPYTLHYISTGGSTPSQSVIFDIRVDSSSLIAAEADAASRLLNILTLGYFDTRGRDD